MSDDIRNDDGRGWKAFQANYDYVMAQSDRLCTVCLSPQMIAAILSQTEYLYWRTRWVSKEVEVSQAFVTQFTENLERQLLMACCDDNLPIQWRYTTDGTLQESTNGGGLWVDAPLYDPRVYSTTFPPVSGSDGADKRCIAATGAAALIKAQVGDQLTDDMTRYTLSQLITDWVATMLQSSNPFQALLTVVANQIFALIIATLIPALTDTVYDQLQCIFYCRMADDASFNTTKWQQVRSDITSQIGGIAGLFFEHLVYLLGEKGITNLARGGGATEGDCSDCDCPSDFCEIDWRWDNVHDVVQDPDNHNSWDMLMNSTGHFSFSSEDPEVGCYWDVPLLFHGSSIWYTDGTGPVPADGIKSKTVPVWNFDTGNLGTDTPINITFSKFPIV